MKNTNQLEMCQKDILNLFATQSREETFEFIKKIANGREYPTEFAGELIGKLEDYIEECQEAIREAELLEYTDEYGNILNKGKYKVSNRPKYISKPPKATKYMDDPYSLIDLH
jgi:hypothetical protein